MKNILAFFITLLSFSLLSAQNKFSVKGLVVNGETYAELPNSTVILRSSENGFNQKAYTDKTGKFFFYQIPQGKYKLDVVNMGYKSFSMELILNENKNGIIIELSVLTVITDDVIIEAIKARNNMVNTNSELGKEEIKKYNFGQDLPSLLQLTPSAVSTSDAGAGVGYSSVRIRGVDATRVNVTLNGVPLNDAESHTVYWVDLPDLAANTESIQIQRGAGTSSNGAAAFGASINIQTTKAATEPYAAFTTSAGSFNTTRLNARFGTGILKNRWTIEGSASRIKSDGYVDRAYSNLNSGFGTITRYGDKSLLKFNFITGTETTYQAWNGVPEDSLKANPSYNVFDYENQTDNYTQKHYQLFYTYQINRSWNATATLHYTIGGGYYEEYKNNQKLLDYNFLTPVINGLPVPYSDLVRRRWLDNDFYGTVLSANYTDRNKWQINLGASINQYEGAHFGEVIWARVWGNSLPTNGSYARNEYYRNSAQKIDGNIFGKATYKYNSHLNLFFDLQARVNQYQFEAPDNNFIIGKQKTQYLFINPKTGLQYLMKDSTELYAYFGIAGHEPTRNELVNTTPSTRPLKETMYNAELGIKRTDGFVTWTANYYLMWYHNQLVLTGKINDVGEYTRTNVKSSYRTGLELIGSLQILKDLKWNIAATLSANKILNYTEYVDDYVNGVQVPFNYTKTNITLSPSILANSIIDYRGITNMEFQFISRYVGRQYLDNGNDISRSLNPYFVNDLRISRNITTLRWFDESKLSLMVYNLFNHQYESNGYTYGEMLNNTRINYNYYFPQAGTNLMLMLQLIF